MGGGSLPRPLKRRNMKKFILILAAALMLASPSFASVGVRVNGNPYPAANDVNLVCGAGANSSPVSNGTVSLTCSPNLATSGIANGGATSIASTVTAVPTSFAYVRKVIDSDGNAAFTAGTLANGIPGQILTIYGAGLSPSGATTGGNFTITPTTSTGFKSVKLSAVGDVVSFLYLDDNFGWTIISYDPGASNSITVTLKN